MAFAKIRPATSEVRPQFVRSNGSVTPVHCVAGCRIANLLAFGLNTTVTRNGNYLARTISAAVVPVPRRSVFGLDVRDSTRNEYQPDLAICATLLNSGHPATLLPGTRHAPVKRVDVL